MDTDYPFVAFKFDVTLQVDNAGRLGLTNPLCGASFAECDGLEMTMEPKVVREGGNNLSQINLVGPVSYAQLSLKRGMTSNLDLWTWFTGAAGGPTRSSRATGTVLMRDGSGNPKLRFTLLNCLPVKMKAAGLNAKDGVIAIEEMQIAYDSFAVARADDSGGTGISGGFSAGVSASASVSGGVSVGASAGASLNVRGGFGIG